MKIALNAYIWTISNMKRTDFHNLHFEGGCHIPQCKKWANLSGIIFGINRILAKHSIWTLSKMKKTTIFNLALLLSLVLNVSNNTSFFQMKITSHESISFKTQGLLTFSYVPSCACLRLIEKSLLSFLVSLLLADGQLNK